MRGSTESRWSLTGRVTTAKSSGAPHLATLSNRMSWQTMARAPLSSNW